jgi:DNA primase
MSAINNVTDEIKQRIDLVDFIGRVTPLKRAGTVYKGNCPFHQERTPSFVVFPHTGTWHCFGACATGGDLFSFVMRKENLDFREALQLLAKEAGVELEPQPHEAGASQRDQLAAVNEAAAAYFEQTLHHHAAAEGARAYLQRRGVDSATARRFRLGFAPDAWSGLRDHLLGRGFPLDLLLEAGLVKRSDERDSTYDSFRSRLIFPIRDRQERVLGFGGRVLDDGIPKYLNTAETPLFHKSHVIYGIELAHRAIRERDQVVIVEGYMDVIAAHQFGYANVVACMGTALTAEQLRQLQRYTSRFVLALDADAAGQQATLRGLHQARQSLARVRKPVVTPTGAVRMEERLGADLFIATVPEGKDPDDLIRRDPQRWEATLEAAKPLVDFYFDVVAAGVDLASARGKGEAVAELTPLIAELGDEIERQHYIQRLSRLVRLDESMIVARVQASARTLQAGIPPRRPNARPEFSPGLPAEGTAPEPPPELEAVSARAPQSSQSLFQRTEQEAHLLANLLSDADLLVWLAGVIERYHLAPLQADDWQDTENQAIFRSLRQYLSSDEPWDVELFQDTLASQLHGRLAQLLAYAAQLPHNDPLNLREDAVKVLLRMRIGRLRAETLHIRYLLDELQRAGDPSGVRSFDAINNRNLRDLARLQQDMVRIPQELFRSNRSALGLKVA